MAVVPGFYSWLRLTQELNYGVFDATQATHTWVRLYQDTAFDPKLTPVRTTIRERATGTTAAARSSPPSTP